MALVHGCELRASALHGWPRSLARVLVDAADLCGPLEVDGSVVLGRLGRPELAPAVCRRRWVYLGPAAFCHVAPVRRFGPCHGSSPGGG